MALEYKFPSPAQRGKVPEGRKGALRAKAATMSTDFSIY
jgi:hypothetical protein